jgi:predicted DNA-binding transcriptional regulator AlpA
MEEKYLREKEVVNLTSLALSTLRNYRCQGKGPDYVKVNGRAIRYRLADVISYMERGRVKLSNV